MPAVFLREEQQVDPEVLAAHRPEVLDRSFVLLVELEQALIREATGGELPQCPQDHAEGVRIQAHRSSLGGKGLPLASRFTGSITPGTGALRGSSALVRQDEQP